MKGRRHDNPRTTSRGPADRVFGYSLVGAARADEEAERSALLEAGCALGHLFIDTRPPGTPGEQPQLTACLRVLRPGCTLVVTRLSRAADSLSGLLALMGSIRVRGAYLRSLHPEMHTARPPGDALIDLLQLLDQFQREQRDAIPAAPQHRARRPAEQKRAELIPVAIEMAAAGQTPAEIAQKLNISLNTAYGYLEAGQPGQRSQQRTHDKLELISRIQAMRESGATIEAIAGTLGAGPKMVRDILAEPAAVRRATQQRTQAKLDLISRIQAMRESGATIEAIAQAMAISHSTVSKYLAPQQDEVNAELAAKLAAELAPRHIEHGWSPSFSVILRPVADGGARPAVQCQITLDAGAGLCPCGEKVLAPADPRLRGTAARNLLAHVTGIRFRR